MRLVLLPFKLLAAFVKVFLVVFTLPLRVLFGGRRWRRRGTIRSHLQMAIVGALAAAGVRALMSADNQRPAEAAGPIGRG